MTNVINEAFLNYKKNIVSIIAHIHTNAKSLKIKNYD